jgi:hypothetical protein
VLAPLRTIAAAARRISEDNLHDRLALQGPDLFLPQTVLNVPGHVN